MPSRCKFIVVLYRRSGLSRADFAAYLQGRHAEIVERVPGLIHHRQNHPIEDPGRCNPGWDAVIELCWKDREAMDEAWRSPEGQAAADDLTHFADLDRTSWSIVDEQILR